MKLMEHINHRRGRVEGPRYFISGLAQKWLEIEDKEANINGNEVVNERF
jgi:hypothetical protein